MLMKRGLVVHPSRPGGTPMLLQYLFLYFVVSSFLHGNFSLSICNLTRINEKAHVPDADGGLRTLDDGNVWHRRKLYRVQYRT